MKVELTRLRIKKGKSHRVDEWLRMANERIDEAETLDRECMKLWRPLLSDANRSGSARERPEPTVDQNVGKDRAGNQDSAADQLRSCVTVPHGAPIRLGQLFPNSESANRFVWEN